VPLDFLPVVLENSVHHGQIRRTGKARAKYLGAWQHVYQEQFGILRLGDGLREGKYVIRPGRTIDGNQDAPVMQAGDLIDAGLVSRDNHHGCSGPQGDFLDNAADRPAL
jgi:hypothetical protein